MIRVDATVFNQTGYRIRFEWGEEGVRRLAPLSDLVIIIDVFSFTTCVDIAVSKESVVFPYRYKDESAITFANSVGAQLAGKRGETPSLSPPSLLNLGPHSRIVLPSPNGSTCTVVAADAGANVIAGCIRNAASVAGFCKREFAEGVISVIACGERWPNGSLRPSIEDFICAGAILSHFDETVLSPEARAAAGAFRSLENHLDSLLQECSSGRELIEKGFPDDVTIASKLNRSSTVPILMNGIYKNAMKST